MGHKQAKFQVVGKSRFVVCLIFEAAKYHFLVIHNLVVFLLIFAILAFAGGCEVLKSVLKLQV